MHDCHDCRYHLTGEIHAYHRCLLAYGHAKEKVKDGLIGQCNDHKPIAKQPSDEVPNVQADRR